MPVSLTHTSSVAIVPADAPLAGRAADGGGAAVHDLVVLWMGSLLLRQYRSRIPQRGTVYHGLLAY